MIYNFSKIYFNLLVSLPNFRELLKNNIFYEIIGTNVTHNKNNEGIGFWTVKPIYVNPSGSVLI